MVDIEGTFLGITHQNSGYDKNGRHWKYYDFTIKDDDLTHIRCFSKVLQTQIGNLESGDMINITELKENGNGLITTTKTTIKKIDKLDIIISKLSMIVELLKNEMSSVDL
jgi:hypothetical protein